MSYRYRLVLLGLLLGLLLAGCGAAAPTPTAESASAEGGPACPDAPGPIAGPIVLVRQPNLLTIAPDGSSMQPLTALANGIVAAHPAWSPDGATLAYTLYYPNPNPAQLWLSPGKICGLDRATGKGRLLAAGADTLTVLEEPDWMPDGQTIVATTRQALLNDQGVMVGQRLGLVRYDPAQQAGAMLVPDGQSPAVSPDGTRLAYATIDPQTQATVLMLADASGQNPRLLFAPANPLTTVQEPIWAPGGAELAFTMGVVGDQPGAEPSPAAEPTATPALALLDQLLGVETARAHGVPAAIFTIGADGAGLAQVSPGGLDDPRVAWGPDGRELAYTVSTGGAALLERATKTTRPLSNVGDFGVSWSWK